MTTPLDPVIARIIPLLPLRDPDNMTPQSARDALRALAASRAAVPPPPVMSAEDTKVKGAAGFLAARVYRNSNDKSPTVVFFHGGGGSPATSKPMTGRRGSRHRDRRRRGLGRLPPPARGALSRRLRGCLRGHEGYRRPYRRIRRRCRARRRRRRQRGRQFGGHHRHRLPRRRHWLAAQLLVYPVTDVFGNFADTKENARFPSRAENAEGYFLSRAVMEWFCGHYLADAADGTDWRVSPLRAKTLAGLAPAVVTTAWFDPLRDEGKAYAEALKAAGVPTSYYDGLGLIHGYFGLGDASETARREAQRARADFRTFLQKGA